MESPDIRDHELKPFIDKLGHPLEEIRLRALDSITQKLKYGLVEEGDLVQEKELLSKLLKWFEFPNCRKQEECLQLLGRLAKHDSAVELLCGLGAVSFLEQLKKDVPPRLQGLVESIVERLLLLPTNVDTVSGQDGSDARPRTSVMEEENEGAAAWQSLATASSCEGTIRSAGNASVEVAASAGNEDSSTSSSAADDCGPADAVSYFPWLPLTSTDHHVLQSTNDSLASGNRALIVSACEFFVDVILYDFPVEVFLQQPDIVRSLLRLVADPPGKDPALVVSALNALFRLTASLKVRVRMHSDAALRSLLSGNEDSQPPSAGSDIDGSELSTASRPSLVGSSELGSDHVTPAATSYNRRSYGRRHGRFADRHSSVAALRHSAVDASTVSAAGPRAAQMSVAEYCLTSSRELLHIMLGCSCFKTAVRVARLLVALHDLLVLAAQPASAGTPRNGAEKSAVTQLGLIVCHRMASVALHWHREFSAAAAVLANVTALTNEERHTLFAVMSCLSLKYLETFVVPSKAADEMPSKVKDLLGVLAFEEALLRSLPAARRAVSTYLPMVDSGDANSLYEGVQVLSLSMSKTCHFLLDSRQLNQHPEEYVAELVNMAEQALFSLPYHQDMEIVPAYCQFYASLFGRDSLYEGTQRYATTVMLKFMSHPLLDVRRTAHRTALRLLKGCLTLENAGTALTRRVRFLANMDIIKELIYFGLEDSSSEVRKYAADILCHMLQCRTLLTEGLWDEVLSTVLPLLPALQAHSSNDTLLGRCIVGLTTSESLKGALSEIERLKAATRGLFLKDDATRRSMSKVFPALVEVERGSAPTQVPSNIFMKLEAPFTDIYRDTDVSNAEACSFDESFSKLYAIIESRTVEPHLRVSAAEQLAVLLRDSVLHKSFVRRGGLDFILANVRCAARPETVNSIHPHSPDLLPACARMLCHLLQHDAQLRRTYGGDVQFMEAMVLCTVQHGQRDERLCLHLAQALTYMTFEDVSQTSTSGRYCLPKTVMERYKLPVRAAACCEVSMHASKLPPSSDPLRGALPMDALKYCWSAAVYGGTQELLQAIDSGHYCLPRSPNFLIAERRVAALKASCPHHVVRRSFVNIANATTHQGVQRAVLDLEMFALIAKLGGCDEVFAGISWKDTFGRFFTTLPRAPADEQLLADVLHFLLQFISLDLGAGSATIIAACSATALEEIVAVCSSSAHTLMACVVLPPVSGGPTPCSRRSLQNDLLEILCCYGVYTGTANHRRVQQPVQLVGDSPQGTCSNENKKDFSGCSASLASRGAHFGQGNIVRLLLQKLSLADAANFYNLAALESIISALMHVTSRPGWSVGAMNIDASTLCYQLLDALFEVLSAFNVDKQGLATSYMGKGVIRSAALCLLNVLHELVTEVRDEHWVDGLLFWRNRVDRSDSPRTSGDFSDHLSWMVPLWSYHSCAEVRAAAFAAAAAFARSRSVTAEQVSVAVIWQAATSAVTNTGECSLVRRQAASVLCCIVALLVEKLEKKKSALRQDERDVLASICDGELVRHLGGLLKNYVNDADVHDLVQLLSRGGPPAVMDRAAASLADSLEVALVQDSCCLLSVLCSAVPDAVHASISQLDLRHLLSRLLLAVMHLPSCVAASYEFLSGADGLRVQYALGAGACTLDLLRQCVLGSRAVRQQLLGSQDSSGSLDELVALFTWQGSDRSAHVAGTLVTVRVAAAGVLSTLMAVEEQGGALLRILPLLLRSWADFTASCFALLSSKHAPAKKMAMEWLLLTLVQQERLLFGVADSAGPMKSQLTSALDTAASGDSTSEESAAGWQLCHRLLAIYDSSPLTLHHKDDVGHSEKVLVTLVLAALTVSSRSAKACAFKAGLVETVVEHAKGLIKEADDLTAPLKANRTVLASLVTEALLLVNLLSSFIVGGESYHSDVSEAVLHADISGIVQPLWPWCSDLSGGSIAGSASDSRLALTLLTSLKRFAEVRHQPGSSQGRDSATLRDVHGNAPASECGTAAPTGCCATHAAVAQLMVRIASTEWSRLRPDVAVLREAMAGLSIMALQPAMISHISKSNVAAGFLSVNPRDAGRNKKHHRVAQLWLKFFLNLSYSPEGQQVVLKHKESLPILVELSCGKDTHLQELSLLILYNLSCANFGGQRLLSNENFCPVLHLILCSTKESAMTVVLELVSSLLNESAKSKVLLKNSGLAQSLSEAASHLHAVVTTLTAERDKTRQDSQWQSRLVEMRRLLALTGRLQESLRSQ